MAHRHAATQARRRRACVIAVATCALGCSDGELGDAARDAEGASDERGATNSVTTGTGAGAGGHAGVGGGGGTAGSAAGAGSGTASVRLDPGETNNAELVETLPVAQNENAAERRVVMRLGPGALPDLAGGDRLLVASEAQVTTRCDVGQLAPGCDYNPDVRALLLLTGEGDDTDPQGTQSHALAAAQTQGCTHADHHCMFTFFPADTAQKMEGAFDLPCIADGSCRVNLVMWAWHPDARPGGQDHLLVGSNDGNYLDNGIVEGDAGRLGALRERGVVEADRTKLESSGGGPLAVGTDAEPVVVFAHRLDPKNGKLLAGTHFTFEAKLVVEVADRARFSSLVFLTKDAGEKAGNGLDAVFPKAVGEHNGINCTAGTTPCTLRKTGVFRVNEDIDGPVYLNVTVRSAVPGGGSTSVKVDRGASWVRTSAYDAALGK